MYNRGNRKQNIFRQRGDYERFLKRTKEYKERFGITLLCYCLMKNHFHFLLRQDTEIPLTIFMLRLGTSYAKYFNIKYGEVGSLFQDRFRAKIVETDEYFLSLSRYIHRNPLELLSTPGVELRDYVWSSYSAYLSGEINKLVNPTIILNYFARNNPEQEYRDFTEQSSREDLDPWG